MNLTVILSTAAAGATDTLQGNKQPEKVEEISIAKSQHKL